MSLKSNRQRAKIAMLLIWIVCAVEVVSLISGYFQYELLESAAEGGSISPETAHTNDLREQILGALYSIAFIISSITFIQWFRRAYYNLHQKVNPLLYTEDWAAGSWFVPILNFFRPYQIMKELFEETKEALLKRGLIEADSLATGILGVWWTLWVISRILGQSLFRYSLKAESIDQLMFATEWNMVGNLIGIPLAIVAATIIKNYAAVEHLLLEVRDESSDVDSLFEEYAPAEGQ